MKRPKPDEKVVPTPITIEPVEYLPEIRGWVRSDTDETARSTAKVIREFKGWKGRLEALFAMGVAAPDELINAVAKVEAELQKLTNPT